MSTKHMDGYGKKIQIFAGKGVLGSLYAQQKSAGTIYLQLWDSLAEPANFTVVGGSVFPPIPLEAGQLYENDVPKEFNYGCWAEFSSTADSLTRIVTDDGYLSARVV